MPSRTNQAIVHRINDRLRTLGKTPRGASLEAGLGADAIRDLERRPEVIPRLDTIEALAGVLETTPEWLAFAIDRTSSRRSPHLLRIIGEVAAGLWLDVDADRAPSIDVAVAPDPRYPEEAQYGLLVRGTSVNRAARPGDVIKCLDIALAGIVPLEHDLVVVERRRAQAGQKEVTAKRFARRGRLIELAPDSDDPRWQEPIVFDPQKAPDDEEIAIVAVALGVYRPIRR